ncbi:phage tail tip fiber protein [Enterobacter hormaechei]|uniref:phage tail tip fiber protein n=1 Tax=Enterobacter hormaechei TaxID=158836 RepID=UPI003D6F14B5|nr:DUF1983 domain-containing protein [Enterobacter hormaechei]
MSEYANIPQVTTLPKPFGVAVKWKWPDGSHWFSGLELQCLFEDGRFEKERICWPVTEKLISGLKASERVQVRLRPVAADGSARDWRTGDWIEGISSADTDEILQALDAIRSSKTFELLNGWRFIKDSHIGDGLVSANFSVKMDLNQCGKQHPAGMSIGVEGAQRQVVFEADRFKVQETAEPISSLAGSTGRAVAARLSDDMQELVLKAVRESDLFTSLQTAIAAQEASILGLQQTMVDAVNDAIRNSLRPGGAIWNNLGSR